MDGTGMHEQNQSQAVVLERARQSAQASLEAGVNAGVFPGASAAIGWQGKRVLVQAGRFIYDSTSSVVTQQTIYDCASLTKVVATTTMAMMLVDRGLLELDAPLASYLPEFLEADDPRPEARRMVTIRHLLAHTSGLPAYVKFFLRARRPEHVLTEAISLSLEQPPGERTVYSDVGFILLGEALVRIAAQAARPGQPHQLDDFCAWEIFQPLLMASTMFAPPKELRSVVPPTEEDDEFRRHLVHGEVHDENAWVMGGIAPHSGLFSTAPDLAVFCQFMLNEGNWFGKQLVQPETIREFTCNQPAVNGAPRGLGWDKPSPPSSSGKYFSPASYGHLGFTGTSIWIDPEQQLYVVLLTNRIHPTRANEAIRTFRPAFHDSVVKALNVPIS
jgi:CubicO group peptidase (beta-lactamase class C family)